MINQEIIQPSQGWPTLRPISVKAKATGERFEGTARTLIGASPSKSRF